MVIERLVVMSDRKLIGKGYERDSWGVGNVQNLNLDGDYIGVNIGKKSWNHTLYSLVLGIEYVFVHQ